MKIFYGITDRRISERGITLLLVVVLISAILSMSIGIFNVLVGEFQISGDAADSFRAFYAADQGIEWVLYRDRQQGAISDGFTVSERVLPGGACYTLEVRRPGAETTLISTGQFECGADPVRPVRRRFEIIY